MSSRKKSSSSSAASIPSKMRETVQNLREIVNCTEQEIYEMLRECNMDPNETVHRLLTQDTFHEVKSKREKKKEIKVTGESRSQRATNSNSGRGVRGGADQTGRSAVQTSCDDSEVTRGKHMHTKENGARVSHTSSVLGSRGTTSNSSMLAPSSYSDALGNTHFPGLSDGTSLPSQPSATLHPNWLGVRGQLSMADIVKMGRPLRKPSNTPLVAAEVSNSLSHKAVVPNTSQGSARCSSTTVSPLEANQEKHSSQGNVFQVSEVGPEPSAVVSQHESLEEWTLVDHSADESPVLVDVSGRSSVYHEPSASSSVCMDEVDSHLSSHIDDIHKSGDVDGENLPTLSTTSDVQVRVDGSDVSSSFDDGSLKNVGSSQQHEAEDVHEELSSGLQNLNLRREEQSATSTEENPAVIIPGHLQVTNADCSRLSFGSFGLGIGASLHAALSKPAKSNLETTSVTENAPPIDFPDTRNPEFYNNDQSRTATDDSVPLITGSSSRTYDVVSASQPEPSRDNTFISEQPLQFNIPSVSSLAFSDAMQPDYAAYSRVQVDSEIQNIAPPTSLTPRTDSTPSSLLVGNERELPFLHSLANQSIPTKYSPSVSSFGGPTISMPEVLKSGLFSNFQSIPQTTSSTTIFGGSALQSHPPLPTCSQPTLSLGPLTNIYSYPVLPQSIAYMPFSGNSAFHQSPASLQSVGMKYGLPPFKSGMPLNGLPQSLPVGSGYGGFGSSANIPGAFLQNHTNVAAGIGYEEALRSQYKESVPLHQGDNSSLWHSRTLPSVPANSFYGLQGSSQQASSVLRQVQQPAHMGMMGYPNLYNSQLGGISREHQQLPSQGNLNVSQGQPSQQSHHLWQHNY